ncbi:MAG: aminotransferase DegT [Nitrospira sp.]|nr:aminotransferase DegT [Nitrospira sp.]TKB91198.1 MAG: aminotransferase DegT [Nitrospira sp.]
MKLQRYLTPTAAPVSWLDLMRGGWGLFQGRRARESREREFAQYFGVKYVFALSSGKAALTTILQVLAAVSPRRKVIVPAYTCFSVPSAILRAGCDVVPCDVDPETLDYRFPDLEALVSGDILCIVSPHLLGHAADILRTKGIACRFEIPVVEDAAQAMGGAEESRWLGTQADIGFFSLGRGKNVTAGSGGVILTNSDSLGLALAQQCKQIPEASWISQVQALIEAVAMAILIRPSLYWLPAGLPFLGLGETKFELDFPLYRLDGMRASLLASWQARLEASNTERLRHGQDMLNILEASLGRLGPTRGEVTVYLRVPVILPSAEMKARICDVSAASGLGVSGLYPSPISEIPALRSTCGTGQFPGAQVLADRMVTCPVHHYVTHQDIMNIADALQGVVVDKDRFTGKPSALSADPAPATKMKV